MGYKENADDVKKLINTLAMSQAGTIGATGVLNLKPNKLSSELRKTLDGG